MTRIITLLAVIAASVTLRAQAPAVQVSKQNYEIGETIAVSFANAPGNAKDWIGVYPAGVTPGTVNSTIWSYADGTQNGTEAVQSGSVTFPSGLTTAGEWTAFLLENDGYTILAQQNFTVGQTVPSGPSVQLDKTSYEPGEAITANFAGAPGNAKDWIGIYPAGVTPGTVNSTLWFYLDGTQSGTAVVESGSVTFPGGLATEGEWTAYLLENDGYTILAQQSFTVGTSGPSVQVGKPTYETREAITVTFSGAPGNTKDWIGIYPAGITPGPVPATAWLYVDGTQGGNEGIEAGSVTFANGLNTAGDWTVFLLENDGYTVLAQRNFTVVQGTPPPVNNVVPGTPVYFENFDATAEGELPAGWSVRSYTEVLDETLDLGNLNSQSYANWVVVSTERFRAPLLSYLQGTPTEDYRRVLSTNLLNQVNGVVVTNLGTGNILFGNAGYRTGRSQVLFAFTPEFDLSGRTNVHLSFHSLYEQNQDSLGALEYSIDGGTNWLPIVYLIHSADVLTNANGVDAVATFTTEYTDVAYYDDPETGETLGGTYGAFIAAPVSEALAPYISGRIDDDPIESKRVEYFRLPAADNQARVRFRFAYAGTDSWYWGVDNFGLYSASAEAPSIRLTITRSGNEVTVAWTGEGGRLQKSATLGGANWQDVSAPAGTQSVTETIGGPAAFYRVVAP
jgi:hypothetical protein